MQVPNLNPSNYKRVFTFGCSFTNYYWPTWADIIAQDIPYFENWGRNGAGNHFIFNSIMEAHNKHTFTKDDLIMVMWTNKNREDRYADNKWITASAPLLETVYGRDWVRKFADPRGFMIRDLALIQSAQIFLDTLDSDWINMSINTFANGDIKKIKSDAPGYFKKKFSWNDVVIDLHHGTISNLFENLDVVECYKSVFLKLKPSVFNMLQDTEEYRSLPRPNEGDGHPTPVEILKYLDLIFPNNTISNTAREYAESFEDQIWNLKRIDNSIFKTTSQEVSRL